MKYEMIYLIPSQYADDELNGVMKRMAGMIEKAGGKVSRHENLGRLKLAYPIKQARHGTYVLAHIESEPKIITVLDRQLRLSEELLRHQIVVLSPEAEKKTYQLTAYVAPLSEEARKERGECAVRPRPSLPPPPPAAPRQTAPFDIADLDKKLNEILEDDMSKGV